MSLWKIESRVLSWSKLYLRKSSPAPGWGLWHETTRYALNFSRLRSTQKVRSVRSSVAEFPGTYCLLRSANKKPHGGREGGIKGHCLGSSGFLPGCVRDAASLTQASTPVGGTGSTVASLQVVLSCVNASPTNLCYNSLK